MKHLRYSDYIVGFVGSIILTLTSFYLVVNHMFQGWSLIYVIMALATTQFIVQLICFLHLGREKRPYWNLTVFIFMAGVLLIVVFGSLWIMKNLNYNHNHNPNEINQYIEEEEVIHHTH